MWQYLGYGVLGLFGLFVMLQFGRKCLSYLNAPGLQEALEAAEEDSFTPSYDLSPSWAGNVKPVLLLTGKKAMLYYFRTKYPNAPLKESLRVYLTGRSSPLDLLYTSGEPDGILGGFILFEILEDEARAKEHAKAILRIARKHYGQDTRPSFSRN